MVNEDQIKWYMPLHELDELKPDYDLSNLVDLSADDLFLISKISAYATDEQNAVTVSKKLSYGNFSSKLSDDFSIYEIKQNIISLSVLVSSVSNELCVTSSLISATLDSLCSTVDTSFIKKYGTLLCNLIITSIVPDYPDLNAEGLCVGTVSVLTADIVTLVELSDGQITNLTRLGIDLVFSLENKTIASGVIYGSSYASRDIVLTSTAENEMTYTTTSACYLDISLSVVETDASPAPLELGIVRDNTFKKIALFNNPGGLVGTLYWNFYHTAAPIAAGVEIELRYAGSHLLVEVGSKMHIEEYKFYAIATLSELANYILKPAQPIPTTGELALYKIAFNSNGLIICAERYDIPLASTSTPGIVKLAYTSGNKFGLSANLDGSAFVNVPTATTSLLGVIKSNDSDLFAGLDVISSKVYVLDEMPWAKIPIAASTLAGVVKTSAQPTYEDSIVAPVYLDDNLAAKVKIPIATGNLAGILKTSALPSYDSIVTPVYLDDNLAAKVKIPIATGNLAGVFTLSLPPLSAGISLPVYYDIDAACMMANMPPPPPTVADRYMSPILLMSRPNQNNADYTTCDLIAPWDGYYEFTVAPTLAEAYNEFSRKTQSYYCELIINHRIHATARIGYWRYRIFLKEGTQMRLNAWTSASMNTSASAARAISGCRYDRLTGKYYGQGDRA